MDQVDTISVAVGGININKVEPLGNKRLIAFINHFLTTTVSFLNQFSRQIEERLEKMHYQICQIETNLNILESKLSTSELNFIKYTAKNEDGNDIKQGQQQSTLTNSTPIPIPEQQNESINPIINQDQDSSNTDTNLHLKDQDNNIDENERQTGDGLPIAKDDERFAKYFKMVKVGIPAAAVKIKMSSEGVDPSILDNPNVPVP